MRGLELRNWHAGYQLVYMANTHDVTFEDLYMHDADKGFHASPSAPSSNIQIKNCTIEAITGGTFTHGLSTPAGGTGWVVSDSTFKFPTSTSRLAPPAPSATAPATEGYTPIYRR